MLNINGRLVSPSQRKLQAFRRQMGIIFQKFNLWPHKTVLQNIVEGPIVVMKVERKKAVEEAMALLEKQAPAQGERLPLHALRRSAAAGGHRPRPGHEPGVDAVRRGDLRPRSRAGGRGAQSDAGSRRGGNDHDRGHPRDGVRPRCRRRDHVPRSFEHRGSGSARPLLCTPRSPRPSTPRFAATGGSTVKSRDYVPFQLACDHR